MTYEKEVNIYNQNAVKNGIDEAGTKATNYVTEVSNGIMVHPEGDDTTGWRIRDTLELLKSGVSYFKVWIENSVAKVRIGRSDSGHTDIDTNGMKIYGGNGSSKLAEIGYSNTKDRQGNDVLAPYFTLGNRGSGDVGKNSFVSGEGCIATNEGGSAGGCDSKCYGHYASTHGYGTYMSQTGGFSCGMFNSRNAQDIFAVGNGTDNDHRKTVFSVRNGGALKVNGNALFSIRTFTLEGSAIPAKSTGEIVAPVANDVSTPVAIRGYYSSSASLNIYRLYYDADTGAIRARLYNSTDSAITATISVSMLCIPTMSL